MVYVGIGLFVYGWEALRFGFDILGFNGLGAMD
jgi:hypothetical protein